MSLLDKSQPSFLIITGKRKVKKTELIKLIEEISGMDIRLGIAARKIEGRGSLEKEGFHVWEIGDFL
ncbi:hypothetical protein [uncultured Methanolobus sp.]|uniref:hypothetical protein n=1 Tax=uncultured Methanolobus sp. TaxID=218300 RepID=UPI002AAB9827|nr:hypothetical protein [uncultured Methanolobus sp.]